MKNWVLALIAVVLSTVIAARSAAADDLLVPAPGKELRLATDRWTKVNDPTNFASNFEETRKSPTHEYGRMVTVYLIPMSDDRKVGLRISDDEYLELFVVHPGLVTAQTRLDKGQYWLLCRETFRPKKTTPIDISNYRPFLSEDEARQLWSIYQEEIDETRYLLRSQF